MFWFPCVNYLALSSFSNCCIGILQALRRFQAQLDVFYSFSGLFPVAACDETPGERAHGHQLQHNYVNGVGWSLRFGIYSPMPNETQMCWEPQVHYIFFSLYGNCIIVNMLKCMP